MRFDTSPNRAPGGRHARYFTGLLLLCFLVGKTLGQEATEPAATELTSARDHLPAAGASPEVKGMGSQWLDGDGLKQAARSVTYLALRWYIRTPAAERMTWGGLAACAGLGLVVLLERALRLRRSRIIPGDFTARFLDRLHEGKLDGGKALDYCEMNPSPAARVALAAVRRWGRPAADLERAVALTHKGEAESLRRNVGTLRRIAALTPLIGVLGTLLAVARVLAMVHGPEAATATSPLVSAGLIAWGPALGHALSPMILGLTIATFALVAYDSLVIRIERLSGSLDQLGAETIDAIAMLTQPAASPLLASSSGPRISRPDPGHTAMVPVASRAVDQPHFPRRQTSAAGYRNASQDHDIGF